MLPQNALYVNLPAIAYSLYAGHCLFSLCFAKNIAKHITPPFCFAPGIRFCAQYFWIITSETSQTSATSLTER